MKIETKFNIGDRVWIVDENNGEVCVYSDYVSSIIISEEKGCIKVEYWLKYSDCDSFVESAVIPYEDIDLLILKIKAYDDRIMDKQTAAGE